MSDSINFQSNKQQDYLNLPKKALEQGSLDLAKSILKIHAYESVDGSDFDLLWYYRWLQIVEYFAGEFNETTGNEAFAHIDYFFFKHLYSLGQIGVTYENNEFQIWDVIGPSEFKYNQIKVVRLYDSSPIIQTEINKYHNDLIQEKDLDQVLIVNWGGSKLNFIMWKRILQDHVLLRKVFLNNCFFDMKKFLKINNSSDPDVIKKELASVFNVDTPWIEINGTPLNKAEFGSIENVISEMTKGASMSNIAYENLNNHWNLEANFMGYATAQQIKKERLTTSEGVLNLHNTSNYQNVVLKNLRSFSLKAKKLWGVDLSFDLNNQLNQHIKNNLDDHGGGQDERLMK